MGGIVSSIFGGGNSQQSSQATSASGFSQLPASIQNAYTNYAGNFNNIIGNTPTTQTPAAQAATNSIANGVGAVTPQSIQSAIQMQQNPYNQSVIDAINRAFTGQESANTQAADVAGNLGSNRYQLGANDIANTQAQTIGSFLQGQYNTNLQNALTTIPQMNLNSALQTLNTQAGQQLYPATALSSYGAALGILPSNGGSTSQSTSQGTSSYGPGLLSWL